MDTQVRIRNHAAHAQPMHSEDCNEKKMYGKPVTFRLLSVLMVSVFFGSAARADVVSDWNTIAVNTAVANNQNPFAQARYAAIAQLAVFEASTPLQASTNHILGP